MTLHRRISRSGARQKRALGVQAILEWAFRVEKARLELPSPKNAEEQSSGFGMEYVLIQRAQLGCQIDGGRYKMGSYTHADAEVVAATLASLPDALGGLQMAIRVAELARAGMTPDWMPGAVPRCVPVDVRRNQHGERAVTEVVGVERVQYRGRWRSVEVLACPVTWSPHPQQIESARQAYSDWRQALGWVREGLIEGKMLRDLEVVDAMPKMQPWSNMPDENQAHNRATLTPTTTIIINSDR